MLRRRRRSSSDRLLTAQVLPELGQIFVAVIVDVNGDLGATLVVNRTDQLRSLKTTTCEYWAMVIDGRWRTDLVALSHVRLLAVPLIDSQAQVQNEDVAAVERGSRKRHLDHTNILDGAADVQQTRLVRRHFVVFETSVVT